MKAGVTRAVAEGQIVVSDPLWPAWRAVVDQFRFSRMLSQLLTSPSGWGFYGVDVISTLRSTPMAKGALIVLGDVPMAQLGRLAALAGVNARRNEAMWRMAALFYVTVPVALFLAGLEGAPDFIKRVIDEAGALLAVPAVLMTLWLIFYFANHWRARQIEAVIELVRIERGTEASDLAAQHPYGGGA